MRSVVFLCAVLALGVSAGAQDLSKPWTDWGKKDAEKVLNDSAWGQTYTVEPTGAVDTTAVTNTRPGMAGSRSGESGEVRPSTAMKYRVRFMTAKPVREAFGRMVVFQQPSANAELKAGLQSFIDRDFGDLIVVTLSIEAQDERMTKGAMMGLSRLTSEALKDKVYLERKDGKRAVLTDYRAPGEDGMGAKLVFARTVDGQPFIDDAADTVKFFFQLSDKVKITTRHKVAAMSYGGKLEY